MKLKAIEILDYYDYPLLFIAENDKKHTFLCMLVDETDYLEYLVVESTASDIEKMKNNEKDIRSIFEESADNKYYYAKMNSKTDKWFQIDPISQKDVIQYFPDRGVFLSEEGDECTTLEQNKEIHDIQHLKLMEYKYINDSFNNIELILDQINNLLLKFSTNIDQDDIICALSGTKHSEVFIDVDFNDYTASYRGENKCKEMKVA